MIKGKYLKLLYLPLLGTAMLLMMFRPMLMAGILSVEQFAQYALGLLISTSFSMLGCLGLQPLIQRAMPINFVKGREIVVFNLLTQCFFVATACLVFIIITLYSVFQLKPFYDPNFLAISVFHGFSQQVFLLACLESRSRSHVIRFSYQNLARAALVLIVGFTTGWLTLGASHVLFSEAITAIFVTSIILKRVETKAVRLNMSLLCRLAIRSLSEVPWINVVYLLGVMVLAFLILNIDRWIAASMLTKALFAQYAFVWIVLSASQALQMLINTAVFPLMAKKYALTGMEECYNYAFKASVIVLLVGSFFAWPVFIIFEFVVRNWFPSYSLSLSLLPVFLTVSVVRVSDFWSSYLIILKKEKILLLINFIVLIVVLLVWSIKFIFSKQSLEIVDVSILVTSLALINYLAVVITSYSLQKKRHVQI